ncbi:MAG: hypothetical protein VX871_05450 [Pseudomonadota bacterium]|nr:hypothetical protein [Pseudomonadota bacterium]
MTQKQTKPGAIGRLEEVLAARGAEPARWPDADRTKLQGLCASDLEARRLLGEAAALDRVLRASPAGSPSVALKQRIVAAAVADKSNPARVVPMPAARRNVRSAAPFSSRGYWPAAALAASFALGIYVGAFALGDNAVELAMGGSTVSDRADTLALFSDLTGSEAELPL